MIIKGYKVQYQQAGWSFAIPIVQKKVLIFGFIPYWKKVWEGKHKLKDDADKMHPEPMKRWFTESVEQYENYVNSWNDNKS